ncbi:MAG: DUF4251 domain-containing protein [Winogradskyella sp.]|uniref:DUF4251 domain-containing protein n=1 Tax=Winogradskyella sp. TaxID=1883156 RepID=UPI000F3C86E5|nr:DUF4251 domain-containing protein [Winogradskyella sp.]RNC86231.1 MAG: DUF4251 domain-containing protein [Winogradskyella sp.]
MKKLVLILLLLMVSGDLVSQNRKQRKAEKKARVEAQFKKTKALIDSGKFQFVAQSATPLGNDVARVGRSFNGGSAIFQGNRVNLTSIDNALIITNENAEIFLPFFGRVFFPNKINNQSGIAYNGKIDNYEVKIDKKNRILVKFTIDPKDDFIKYTLLINPSGSTLCTMNSTNRQTISYNGTVMAKNDL